MNITRLPANGIRFECKECGETWFLVPGPDGKPKAIIVDDHHLGMMYHAAEGDTELVAQLTEATQSRVRS